MTFAHPVLAVAAALILPAALLAQRLTFTLERRAYAYSNLPFMTGALKAPEWPHAVLGSAIAASLSCLVAAAAGPRIWAAAPVSSTIVMCLDTSGSMNSQDIRPSRAIAVLSAIRVFVRGVRPGTRIGLVSFAGEARQIIAPTGDRHAIATGLGRIPAPNGQTAIGDGLLAAAAMLAGSGPRAILLITDGANNHGEDPRNAVQKLAVSHIRLDAIAVGDVPAPALQTYASLTGGVFSRAENAGDLAAQMRRFAGAGFAARVPRDCTVPCAIGALLLGAAAWLALQRGAFRF